MKNEVFGLSLSRNFHILHEILYFMMMKNDTLRMAGVVIDDGTETSEEIKSAQRLTDLFIGVMWNSKMDDDRTKELTTTVQTMFLKVKIPGHTLQSTDQIR